MKMRREHRVPLSAQAVSVLLEAREISAASELVFPSPAMPEQAFSAPRLMKLLHSNGLGKRATVHGFRSCFRDWCAETGKPHVLAEAALAHTVNSVEGAYFRSDLIERRRVLMTQWADYVMPPLDEAPSAERSEEQAIPSTKTVPVLPRRA